MKNWWKWFLSFGLLFPVGWVVSFIGCGAMVSGDIWTCLILLYPTLLIDQILSPVGVDSMITLAVISPLLLFLIGGMVGLLIYFLKERRKVLPPDGQRNL